MPTRNAAPTTLGSAFTVAHTVPGRLRLKLPHPHPASLLDASHQALIELAGVRDVRVNAGARSLVVEYDARAVAQSTLLATLLEGAPVPAAQAKGAYHNAVEASTTIDAPPAAVWRVLGDPAFAALHAPGSIHIDGTANGGWTATIEVLGQTLPARVELAERIPEERLVLRIDGRLRARLTTTLRPEGSGTRVHERLEYSLPGSFLSRAVSRVAARPRLQEELTEHLERIARATDDGVAGAAD